MEPAEELYDEDLLDEEESSEVEESEPELSLDDELEAAWDDAQGETPEGEEPQAVEEAPEAPAEDRYEPMQHWSPEYQEAFKALPSKEAQEAIINRERQFEQGIAQKSAEARNAMEANSQFQDMIAPLVPDWQRSGMTPSQGLMRLVALERDMRSDPTNALMSLAQDLGVDLKQTWEQQPYVDPQTQALQSRVKQMEEAEQRRQVEAMQSQQAQMQQTRQNAFHEIQAFSSQVNEDGSAAYPYATDKTVMEMMADSIRSGQARDLHTAYDTAINSLKSHPLFKEAFTQTSSQAQEKVEKARKASRKVSGGKSTTTVVDDDIESDILSALEDAGFE